MERLLSCLLSQIPGREDWIEDGVDGKNREIQPTKIGVGRIRLEAFPTGQELFLET